MFGTMPNNMRLLYQNGTMLFYPRNRRLYQRRQGPTIMRHLFLISIYCMLVGKLDLGGRVIIIVLTCCLYFGNGLLMICMLLVLD